MKKPIYFLTVCFAIFLFCSCRLPEIKEQSPAINSLKTEQKFRVNLPEDHRTGYTWQMTDDYDKNHIERLNEVWHGNEKGVDFNLKTLTTGQTTLTFVMRKFTDTSEIRHYIVKIGEY
jgi:predicted secreted protein